MFCGTKNCSIIRVQVGVDSVKDKMSGNGAIDAIQPNVGEFP